MTRITVRRASDPSLHPGAVPGSTPLAIGAVALGLGLGVAIGFVLGEFAGPEAQRAIIGTAPRAAPRPSVRALVAQAQAALDDDLMLRDSRLEVVPVGRGRIELHGWVNDRRSRARAAHLVGDAVRAEAIINCLRVHGEDDPPVPVDETDADELLA
jgi:hypothetical protein